MSDRIVHARYPGMEIVRYDRAGKWFLEPTVGSLPRQQVTIAQAVRQGVWALDNDGEVFWGLRGGTVFDRELRMALGSGDLKVGAAASAVREGAVLYRALPDGRELVVYQMLPGQHRLVIGPQDGGTYDDAWCYHGVADVLEAASRWKGEGDPPGRWYRHIGSGRRREFDRDGEVINIEVRR